MASHQPAFRLNQAIAKTGHCSRREADRLIAEGRVSVNGTVVRDFSHKVDPDSDVLSINGRQVAIKRFVYIALHKPPGIVTTTADEKGRRTVVELLPKK